MTDDEYYSPTEEENEEAARAALGAAVAALQGLTYENLDIAPVLRAFVATCDAERQYSKALKERRPGFRSVYAHVDAGHVVASALAATLNEDTNEVHPYSNAGAALVTYAHAARVLDAAAALQGAVEDPDVWTHALDLAAAALAADAKDKARE